MKHKTLDNTPRYVLREMILQHGPSLIDDPKRCKALLLDYCSPYRREVNILIKAQEEGVVAQLSASSNAIAPKVVLIRLAQHLADTWMLETTAAIWAVESWALALNIVDSPLKSTTKAIYEETANTHKKHLEFEEVAPEVAESRVQGIEKKKTEQRYTKSRYIVRVSSRVLPLIFTVLLIVAKLANQAHSSESAEASGTIAPAHQLSALHLPEGRLNCFESQLTLELHWYEDQISKHYHYHIEVFELEGYEQTMKLVISEFTDHMATRIMLPCESDRSYRWNITALNRLKNRERWAESVRIDINCHNHICKINARSDG